MTLFPFFPLVLVRPHNILCSQLRQVNINPYIINWLISFLDQRKQRVVVDGYRTEYVSINRGCSSRYSPGAGIIFYFN